MAENIDGGGFNQGTSVAGRPKRKPPAPAAPKPAPTGGGSYGGGGGGSYSGGGGGSYGGGGGSVGSNSSGYIAPVAPPRPAAPSLQSFLAGDSTYSSQMSELKKALNEYLSRQSEAKTKYSTNYTQDFTNLGKARDEGALGLKDDYASRGLLQSGLFADANSDFMTGFQEKFDALDKAKAEYLAGLGTDLTDFREQQRLARIKARQDAAARREIQYGL